MTNSNKLFLWRTPYDLDNTEALFAAAMAENARFQVENCPDYARIFPDRLVRIILSPSASRRFLPCISSVTPFFPCRSGIC